MTRSLRALRAFAPLLLAAASAAAPAQPVERPSTLAPADVVQLFVAACVRADGFVAETIDWALARGFAPPDPQRGALPSLLGDAMGSVLAMPGSGGELLLAAAEDGRCTVWADRQPGPALKLALQHELDALRERGASVRAEPPRTVAHDGQWRQVQQWRFRNLGSERELDLGAATTLVDAPAAQVLHTVPVR